MTFIRRHAQLLIQCVLLCFVLIVTAGSRDYQQSTQASYIEDLKNLSAHTVSVSHGQLEYYRFGRGTPIVLIPGYLTDISSWNRTFLRALAEQHDVILVNNRNVAGSVIQSSRYESQDLAQDTYQLIQALRLHKPTILGISMGGMIAQQLAVLHSQALGSLILINTAIAGRQSVQPTSAVKQQMLTMPRSELGRYLVALKLFFPFSWRIHMAYTLMTDRFQPLHYKAIDSEAIMPAQQHLLMHWLTDDATAEKLKKLKLPVLILNGEADAVIPPINSVILARTIPQAQLVRWKDGGHGMNYQYPEQIAQQINAFLTRYPANSRTEIL